MNQTYINWHTHIHFFFSFSLNTGLAPERHPITSCYVANISFYMLKFNVGFNQIKYTGEIS